MRFRMGFVMGFGAGYYLGAMAGRERYDQINRSIAKLKGSEPYAVVTEKAKEVVDHGKELVDARLGHAAGAGNGAGGDSPYTSPSP